VRERVLAALSTHGSLAAEQITAFTGSQLDALHSVLATLREQGFVDAVALTKFEGKVGVAVAYWRLTEAGKQLPKSRHP
jgi:predicted ArsR family transcriptional regulator